MSGTYPIEPRPESMRWRSEQPSMVSLTHSKKRQARSQGGQRWSFDISYSAQYRNELMPLYAFAIAQRGQLGTFSFSPWLIDSSQGSTGGTPLARSLVAAGERTVPTDGWPALTTPMRAGDFVKFAGHSKVYFLVADVVANAIGNADLVIEPGLMASVADNSAITVSNVPFLMAFADDVREVDVAPGGYFTWSCRLVEVLP